MKRILLMLLTIMSTTIAVRAQQFYESWEVTAELKYWESEAAFDYLVQNGIPVTLTWETNGEVRGVSATYLHQNKFVALRFQDDNIELCGYSNSYPLSQLNEMFAFLSYFDWYSGVKFDKIVYDIWWDRILIPIGTDSTNGAVYAISISLYPTYTSAPSLTVNTENKDEQYYNLNGVKVNPEDAHGQILIKTNGQKATKFINK